MYIILSLVVLLITECQSVTCDIEDYVVHDYNINENLINKGWTRCYLQSYGTVSSTDTLISTCVTGADYYLFVGALATSSSVTAYIGAMGPSQVLTGYTHSLYGAYKPEPFSTDNPSYNVYWYNYPSKAFGFSATSSIRIKSTGFCSGYGCRNTPCDSSENGDKFRYADSRSCNTDNQKLSWITNGRAGGRAGTFWSSSFYKVIYYRYCGPTNNPTQLPTKYPTNLPTTSPTPIPTNAPTDSPSNQPTDITLSPSVAPSNAPTQPPTLAPTNSPTFSPSASPTHSPYQMVEINGSYICANLANSHYVLYNITFESCVYQECWYNNECLMVNYIVNTKTASDSRCYIFDKQCNIHGDDGIESRIAIRGYQNFCVNYPYDWTDKYVDTCYYYESLNWCKNNKINTAKVSVEDVVSNSDYHYGYNANQACCECGGGVELIEQFQGNLVVSFESSVQNNGLSSFNSSNLLCEWKYKVPDSQKWRTYDNLNLLDLCIKLREKVYNKYIFIQNEQLYNEHIADINCDVIIDKSYKNNGNIVLCDFDDFDENVDNLYFILMYIGAGHQHDIEIYLNTHWFNIQTSLLSESITVHNISYAQCLSALSSLSTSNSFYGIFPCDTDTNAPTAKPTLNPTLYPTRTPTLYPSLNPSLYPTLIPTANPKIEATLDGQIKTDNLEQYVIEHPIFITLIVISSVLLLVICIYIGFKIVNYGDKTISEEGNDAEIERLHNKIRELHPISSGTTHNTVPSAPLENSGEMEDGVCIICCRESANMFNDPCGHVTYCKKCANNALSQDNKCPTCRKRIQCKNIYAAGFTY